MKQSRREKQLVNAAISRWGKANNMKRKDAIAYLKGLYKTEKLGYHSLKEAV